MAKKKKKTIKGEIAGQQANPVILLFLLISGACGLVYEILWMKMLTLTMGNTVFAFSTVLTAFMGRLALGSFLAGRFIDKIRNPLKTYAILEGGIGLYALLLPLLIAGTQPLFRLVYQSLNPSWYTFGLLRFIVCGILPLVPTILMGATLPVLSQYFAADAARLGRTVGLLYGINTLGAVLGSFMAGFLLVPWLGTQLVILVAVTMIIVAAGAILLKTPGVSLSTPGFHQPPANQGCVKRENACREYMVFPRIFWDLLKFVVKSFSYSIEPLSFKTFNNL